MRALMRLGQGVYYAMVLGLFTRHRRWRKGRISDAALGQSLAAWLERLGPVFIKVGQALSIRRDLLPVDIADALATLRDDVCPFPSEEAQAVIESAWGQALATVLQDFVATPIAAASVAQVHAATLKTGEAVVIKVLRPGIEQSIRTDVICLRQGASLLERLSKLCRQLALRQVVDEIARSLEDELDLTQEAASAAQVRRAFLDDPRLDVPAIHWTYTSRRVLVQDRVQGVSLTDIQQLRALGISMPTLAAHLVELFFTQLFRDRFFHADLHPGNIFVDVRHLDQPRLILVDFGIMGTLSVTDQYYLSENFLAFFHRDYARVAALHIQSGWVPPHTRPDRFEMSIRAVSEPIFNRPLKDISCAQLLMRLFQTAQAFEMKLQPQLVLLQKTLFAVEGVGRELDPDLNLWQVIQPYMEHWIKEQKSLRHKLQQWSVAIPEVMSALPELSGLLKGYLQRSSIPPQLPTNHRPWRYFIAGLICASLLGMFVGSIAWPVVWGCDTLCKLDGMDCIG